MPKKTHRKKPQRAKKDNTFRITVISFTGFMLTLAITIFFSLKPAGDPHCANTLSCAQDLSGRPSTNNRGVYFGQSVRAPDIPNTQTFAIENAKQAVLGDTTADKHVYVDLTHQHLYAYQGSSLFMSVPIASGLYNPTPTGDFHIWVWLRATRMVGGKGADFYDLPNVPYTMYFYNGQTPKAWGYSLHGEYWYPISGLGTPRSHGCVNMAIPDAEKLYEWTDPNLSAYATYASSDAQSPLITIYGTTP